VSKSPLLSVVDRTWQMNCLRACTEMNSYPFLFIGARCFDQAVGFHTFGKACLFSDSWNNEAQVPCGVGGCGPDFGFRI